jgi:hypothetical protein
MPSGLITVSGGERLLRERVVELRWTKAGRRWVRAPQNLILPPDVNATVSMLKKLAKGADVVDCRWAGFKGSGSGSLPSQAPSCLTIWIGEVILFYRLYQIGYYPE